MPHVEPTKQQPKGRSPATTDELRRRLPIDLVIFQLLETVTSFTDFDIHDYDLRMVGLPTVAATAAAAADALEQNSEAALRTLNRLMDAVDCYWAICECEGWRADAARLQVCWYQIKELLTIEKPTGKCGPADNNPNDVRISDAGLAA